MKDYQIDIVGKGDKYEIIEELKLIIELIEDCSEDDLEMNESHVLSVIIKEAE